MDRVAAQWMIDSISWYHEIDFGNRLVTRPNSAQLEDHRAIYWPKVHVQTHAPQQAAFRGMLAAETIRFPSGTMMPR